MSKSTVIILVRNKLQSKIPTNPERMPAIQLIVEVRNNVIMIEASSYVD